MHVLRTRQLFDGERFVGAADLLLEGTAVVAVEPPGDHPSDVVVEDLGDASVLPGLVDAHQHLTWDCSAEPAVWHEQQDDDALLARGRDNARQALAAGITTVRDLGGRGRTTLDLRSELTGNLSAGPSLLVSGPPLTTFGGHCHFLGGECGAAELGDAVARAAAMGVDVVKVMATGGNVTAGSRPHESQFGLEQLRVIVEAAHSAGLPVAAHAHGAAGVSDAVAAGVDTIEHCSFMSEDGITEDPALMARLAVSGIPVSITAGSLPGQMPPKMVALMPALLAHLRRLLEAGARCILSTDAGIGSLKPHDVLPRSVTQAVELVDLPVAEALVMCTSRAADVIGVGNRAGRLRAGAPADVLVVAGDVAADPSALLRPLRVLRGGTRVMVGDRGRHARQDRSMGSLG